MLKQILSAIKISALALVLSFGLSYALAWTTPTQNPPNGNTQPPITTDSSPQTKAGALTVGGLTTGTLNVTTGAGAAKVLTSDVNGNATWQTPVSSADNLGNHTALQALNMNGQNITNTGTINANGSLTNYGALTFRGGKNGWSGLQFIRAEGDNAGTLMMHPSYSGFYNAADNRWRLLVADSGSPSDYNGNVYAYDYYLSSAGKWMSSGISCNTKSIVTGSPQTLSCDAGYTMTGGGCIWRSDGNDQYVYSFPNGNGWYCQDNDGPLYSIYVRCCK